MNINWFPGHMRKAANQIVEKLDLIDLCCEIVDARIPYSSSNKMLEELTSSKPRLIILNKEDMASPEETKKWIIRLSVSGKRAIALNSKNNCDAKMIYREAYRLIKEKMEKRKEKGIQNQEIRMLVFGIPNSGKSTFINQLAKKRSAKVGNRPGITTAQQWIKTSVNLTLMDTPGILWNKFEETQALHLAYTGAIRDEVMEIQEIGFLLIKDLLELDEEILINRYGVEVGLEPIEVMDRIAKKSGCIIRGEVDYDRTAKIVLEDFRKLRLGRITLERAENF